MFIHRLLVRPRTAYVCPCPLRASRELRHQIATSASRAQGARNKCDREERAVDGKKIQNAAYLTQRQQQADEPLTTPHASEIVGATRPARAIMRLGARCASGSPACTTVIRFEGTMSDVIYVGTSGRALAAGKECDAHSCR
jgi:hypothetical protein